MRLYNLDAMEYAKRMPDAILQFGTSGSISFQLAVKVLNDRAGLIWCETVSHDLQGEIERRDLERVVLDQAIRWRAEGRPHQVTVEQAKLLALISELLNFVPSTACDECHGDGTVRLWVDQDTARSEKCPKCNGTRRKVSS